jgi:hypothetical protein
MFEEDGASEKLRTLHKEKQFSCRSPGVVAVVVVVVAAAAAVVVVVVVVVVVTSIGLSPGGSSPTPVQT